MLQAGDNHLSNDKMNAITTLKAELAKLNAAVNALKGVADALDTVTESYTEQHTPASQEPTTANPKGWDKVEV